MLGIFYLAMPATFAAAFGGRYIVEMINFNSHFLQTRTMMQGLGQKAIAACINYLILASCKW